MELAHKKKTEEGITSEILKVSFHVIRKKFLKFLRKKLDLVNDSLREGQCPESWKTLTIIPIPKMAKLSRTSEYRLINILPI